MDNNGQPIPKRSRLSTGPTPPWNSSRDFPQLPVPNPQPPAHYHHGPHLRGPSDPHSNILGAHRHQSAAHPDTRTFDQDHRRTDPGPPPRTNHPPQNSTPLPPYGGQSEATMKREQGDDHYNRPTSTGSASDISIATTPAETRYAQHLAQPQFEVHPLPRTQSYPAGVPYTISHSPVSANESYGHAAYGSQGMGQQRQEYATYPTPIVPPKKKPQRAAQACDSCRNLKARCDEGRPKCSSCEEKSVDCNYRDPPPKAQDKTTADLVEAVQAVHRMTQRNEDTNQRTQNHVNELKIMVLNMQKRLDQQADSQGRDPVLKIESEEFKPRPDFLVPPPRRASAQMFRHVPPEHRMETAEHHSLLNEPSLPSNSTQPPETTFEMNGSVEEDEEGPPVNPGQPSIPVNHTTGQGRLLLNRAIKELAGGIIKSDKIKNENYPMLQEERRGLLRVFGRGEGTDRLPGYDRDPMTDNAEGNTPSPSDASSDVGSPGVDWGQVGGLTSRGDMVQIGSINHEGMPDLSAERVDQLVENYLVHINIMHPILVPSKLKKLVEAILRNIPQAGLPKALRQGSHAGFVGASGKPPESPSNKRKRSPGQGDTYEHPVIPDDKPGLPYRTIGTAIVFLVIALGEICEEKGKIPDCAGSGSHDDDWASPTALNGQQSPRMQNSPSISTVSALPSPLDGRMDGDKNHSQSRRTSVEGVFEVRNASTSKRRNLDVIKGLQYFAFATDILGNQAGGNSLQHVHANILASLYHGQLGRPLESHAYLSHACRSLQVILRPKLDRFKKLKETSTPPPAKDNPLIIAFWTCLQLESDIVAELPVPHSGILTLEEDMPSINLHAAVNTDGFAEPVMVSYSQQLAMRKHLNQLHNMFYKPVNDSEFPSVFRVKELPNFPSVPICLENLEQFRKLHPALYGNDTDPPAGDILRARLRAKYYGARVITFRPSLEMVLEHSAKKKQLTASRGSVIEAQQIMQREEEFSGDRDTYKKEVLGVPTINADATSIDDISDPNIIKYAENGIDALIKSTKAFHGLGDPTTQRLIITNVWGTAHAQWGNVITLLAVFQDPILGIFVNKNELRDLYEKTMGFLRLTAQRSSALYIDCKILEHVAKEIGLIPRNSQNSSSFSSGSGDVPMTGH